MYKYGEITKSGKPYLLKEASPDDPIYKIGCIISGRNMRRSSKTTQEKNSSKGSLTPSKPENSTDTDAERS